MGNPQTWWQQSFQEIIQFLSKILVFVWYITVGVVIKIALDSRTQKLTKRQIWIKVAISVAMGYLSLQVCVLFRYLQLAGLIVPICTLLGESIAIWLMANWENIMTKFFPGWFSSIFYKSKNTNNTDTNNKLTK